MIVRKIRREEYRRVEQFCALAFEYKVDHPDMTAEEAVQKVIDQPQSRQDLHWDEWWAAFADDDKTMMSAVAAIPYRMHFDGHDVGMVGIGGVSTLPEYRRQGGIRACFEKALPQMYQDGAAFSYLYPFSTAFYRKFGYELGCERVLHKLDMQGIPKVDMNGEYQLLEQGVDLLGDIQKVYDGFARRYNGMTLEEGIDYLWVSKADPFRDREYTYVYRSADGTPKGVVTYKPVEDQGDRALDASRRFWFADPEGLVALLQLMRRLMADHSHILVNLPTNVKLDAILPEWSFDYIKRESHCYGMVRVVNAMEVLKLARMQGSGELVIGLTDEQIVENNGHFRVTFADGITTSVERTDDAAEIDMPIQEFSRLICGKHDVGEWQWLPKVQLHCEAEKAAKVFYRKPMFINRYF